MRSIDSERSTDTELVNRSRAVIPGGMYGHQATRLSSSRFPQFFKSAHGGVVVDADGHEYVDLMCSWGPIVLGHRDPVVDEAVRTQMALGDCMNGPSRHLVDVAETFVDLVDDADWVMVAKNGTDATTACLTIARAATSRSVILVAEGSYHGAAPWCTPVLDGTLETDRSAMRYFAYNDIADFDRAVEEAGPDLAGVILTPFRHVEGVDQSLVDPKFARHVRTTCDKSDALLILDDVRCGFRMALGGSWEPLGVRADLSAWSKAIANGYPIAAVTGIDSLRTAASSIFVTGSFWMNATPMAAAVATLRRLEAIDGVTRMRNAGERLCAGLRSQATDAGLRINVSGHPSLPYMTFDTDRRHERIAHFADLALQSGVYLHPRHNWFISCALDDALIDRALDATNRAFKAVARRFGTD